MTLYDEIEDTRTTKKTYQMKLNNWQRTIFNIYLGSNETKKIFRVVYNNYIES